MPKVNISTVFLYSCMFGNALVNYQASLRHEQKMEDIVRYVKESMKASKEAAEMHMTLVKGDLKNHHELTSNKISHLKECTDLQIKSIQQKTQTAIDNLNDITCDKILNIQEKSDLKLTMLKEKFEAGKTIDSNVVLDAVVSSNITSYSWVQITGIVIGIAVVGYCGYKMYLVGAGVSSLIHSIPTNLKSNLDHIVERCTTPWYLSDLNSVANAPVVRSGDSVKETPVVVNAAAHEENRKFFAEMFEDVGNLPVVNPVSSLKDEITLLNPLDFMANKISFGTILEDKTEITDAIKVTTTLITGNSNFIVPEVKLINSRTHADFSDIFKNYFDAPL